MKPKKLLLITDMFPHEQVPWRGFLCAIKLRPWRVIIR